MWRITLGLITHRIFLMIIAFCAINMHMAPNDNLPIRSLQPLSVLGTNFVAKINASKEAEAVNRLLQEPVMKTFSLTKDPYLWIIRLICGMLGLPIWLALLFFSNLFLFLFLWELYSLVCRMGLQEVALNTCMLCILWVASYELSLGSSLSLSCWLATMAVRNGLDNQWLLAGLPLGLLALTKPFAVLLIPLFIILFWHYQKHTAITEVARRASYLIVPVGIAVFLNWNFYSGWDGILNDSAFFNLSTLFHGHDSSWTLSQTYLGQTIAILILLIGSITAFIVYASFLHRLVPIYLLLALLLSTPYREVATCALLAAPAFSGLAGASSPVLLRFIQGVFLVFGSIEIFNIF